ncbi:MAG: hypothetical protein FWC71_05190 [Defluviitaleaceae bacterium]|nr:hypothetical protein [Defluviitaleaceae bacterium]
MSDKNLLERNWHIFALAACLVSITFGIVFGYFISIRQLVVAHEAAPDIEYEAAVDAIYINTPTIMDANHTPVYEEAAPTHRYVVTVVDGFVAVFYAAHSGGALKEVTTSTVNTLPVYDLALLEAGIFIYDDEALARILQDYGS